MPPRDRYVLAGGSGVLGRSLAAWWSRQGIEVVVLSRWADFSSAGARTVVWDGISVGSWQRELDGAAVLVNLTGRSVNCRYTARNRWEILASRIDSTRVLGEALRRAEEPPPVWLNASTATIYRHSLDEPQDETATEFVATPAAKDAFSIEVAQAWEQALWEADVPGVRRVALRAAMVFGRDPEGVFGVLQRLARWGLGGTMGDGKQMVSWIHETDFCRAIDWLIEHPELEGPVNLAAPGPLPNRAMMAAVRQAVGRRWGLPATRGMLELGAVLMRTETELILKSRYVIPTRLLASGFRFEFPEFGGAVRDLVAGAGRSSSSG